MNQPASATVRKDGYIQDEGSQMVAELVGVEPGDRVLDMCAAPGGKATAMAASGAKFVAAADVSPGRASVIAENLIRLKQDAASPVVADGIAPPFRAGTFDRVLVDAPCSGLGVLRRRPDARWRVEPEDVLRLAELQRDLLAAAVEMVRPGGLVAFSVCTMTADETKAIDGWMSRTYPELTPLPPPGDPWEPLGRGALLLPQAAGTDGMYLLRLRTPL